MVGARGSFKETRFEDRLTFLRVVNEIRMIAFITIHRSLVPLTEGLCAQIYFRFEILVVLLTSFPFSLLKKDRPSQGKDPYSYSVENAGTCTPLFSAARNGP